MTFPIAVPLAAGLHRLGVRTNHEQRVKPRRAWKPKNSNRSDLEVAADRATAACDGRKGSCPIAGPVRVAALDGKAAWFDGLTPREAPFEVVAPSRGPDLTWDAA